MILCLSDGGMSHPKANMIILCIRDEINHDSDMHWLFFLRNLTSVEFYDASLGTWYSLPSMRYYFVILLFILNVCMYCICMHLLGVVVLELDSYPDNNNRAEHLEYVLRSITLSFIDPNQPLNYTTFVLKF